ncbi:MAG: holo-ACP synthase [Christensenellales bacterium]|jgi:phosphopantetheine--protein transferase-like protein
MLKDWVDAQYTPKGVGIDCVHVSDLRAMDERLGGAFVRRTFTPAELALAAHAADYWRFFAGRFAVKEEVYKALSCKQTNLFDLRIVETLQREDGCPMILYSAALRSVLDRTGGRELLVSIAGEGDYVIAFAQII